MHMYFSQQTIIPITNVTMFTSLVSKKIAGAQNTFEQDANFNIFLSFNTRKRGPKQSLVSFILFLAHILS